MVQQQRSTVQRSRHQTYRAGASNDTNLVLRDGSDNLVIRSINDLLDDATLSQNAIWVGDASNNPEERAAGTTDQGVADRCNRLSTVADDSVDTRWDSREFNVALG